MKNATNLPWVNKRLTIVVEEVLSTIYRLRIVFYASETDDVAWSSIPRQPSSCFIVALLPRGVLTDLVGIEFGQPGLIDDFRQHRLVQEATEWLPENDRGRENLQGISDFW